MESPMSWSEVPEMLAALVWVMALTVLGFGIGKLIGLLLYLITGMPLWGLP